jgi:hypothetical protein
MKTIFIFNDSRPTDELRAVTALGEDGQHVAHVTFTSFTYPHHQFAMGTQHFLDEANPDISEAVLATRASIIQRYDDVYGASNWMPLWLDAPLANADWRAAISRFRMRSASSARATGAPSFSNAALASLLGAIFASADSAPHTTH